MSDVFSVDNDLGAIEAINQRDVEAALAGDTASMMSQWTDDFVLLQPAGPILREGAARSQSIPRSGEFSRNTRVGARHSGGQGAR